MIIRPLEDRVLIKNIEAESITSSGLILTNTSNKEQQLAEVIAVGETVSIAVGSKVICSKYVGTEITSEGEKYIIVRENDILAIVE